MWVCVGVGMCGCGYMGGGCGENSGLKEIIISYYCILYITLHSTCYAIYISHTYVSGHTERINVSRDIFSIEQYIYLYT